LGGNPYSIFMIELLKFATENPINYICTLIMFLGLAGLITGIVNAIIKQLISGIVSVIIAIRTSVETKLKIEE